MVCFLIPSRWNIPSTVNKKTRFTCLFLFLSFFAIIQELCTCAKRLFSLWSIKKWGLFTQRAIWKKKAEKERDIKHLYPQRHMHWYCWCVIFCPLECVYRKSLVIKIMMFMHVLFRVEGWNVSLFTSKHSSDALYSSMLPCWFFFLEFVKIQSLRSVM